MTIDLEQALGVVEYGAKIFLKRYGAPYWGDADDVFSQAKVVAFSYMDSKRFRPEYLLDRVVDGLIDWVRCENRRINPLIRDQEPETVEWNNPEPVEVEELPPEELAAKILAELNCEDRMLLEAVYMKGRSQNDVARERGTTQTVISRRLAEIKTAIRKKYREIC